jgi:hypothetical protein
MCKYKFLAINHQDYYFNYQKKKYDINTESMTEWDEKKNRIKSYNMSSSMMKGPWLMGSQVEKESKK